MSVWMCVQVYKCLPAWEGTLGWVAQVLLVEPQPPPSPELLAVQIENKTPFEKITISSLGKSH